MPEDKTQFRKHVLEIAENAREFISSGAIDRLEHINTDELVCMFEASLTLKNLLKVAKKNAGKLAKV